MVGVIVIVLVKGSNVGFTAVNVGILPTPLEINPIALFEFVQLKVSPEGVVEVAGVPKIAI